MRGTTMLDDGNKRRADAVPPISKKHLMMYTFIFIAAPLLTFLIGRTLDSLFMFPSFPPLPINLVMGFTVFFSGLAIGIRSTRALLKIGGGLPWGELNGGSQTRALVDVGPYSYSRNPMVLGYSLLPCGMGLMFQSLGMAIFVPALTIALATLVIKGREEPNLEKRFGQRYLEYKSKTPFLLPRLPPPYRMSLVYSTLVLAVAIITAASSLGGGRAPYISQNERAFLLGGFILLCATGALLTIRPRILKSFTLHNEGAGALQPPYAGVRTREGHHPNCDEFKGHVYLLFGKKRCSGCAGLLIGSIISAVAAFGLLLGSISIDLWGEGIVWLGIVMMLIGVFRPFLDYIKRAALHFILGASFVLGGLFLLLGTMAVGGYVQSIFALLSMLFMIWAKITISGQEQKRKCERCKEKQIHPRERCPLIK
uniref:Isoprenylcysteine carboxylmethyltransferase family protein n=1 Tax=Candidatus Methanomethylicus mesodigestus TaxID=1867258 RepID=A0A7C3J439_9CREN